MDALSKKYAQHLDNMRKHYKLSRQTFIEGICSTRQYMRYLAGTTAISNSNLQKFCDKLKISLDSFLYSVRLMERKEYDSLKELKTLLHEGKYQKIINYLDEFGFNYQNPQNKDYAKLCYIQAQHKLDQLNNYEVLRKLSDLINYPIILERDIFNYVELSCLLTITELEVSKGRTQALDKLKGILLHQNLSFASYEVKQVLPTLFSTISLIEYRLNQPLVSLELTNKGIAFLDSSTNLEALYKLFYVKAISLLKQERREEAELSAIRCLCTIIAMENPAIFKEYYDALTNDFGINPLDKIHLYKESFFQ